MKKINLLLVFTFVFLHQVSFSQILVTPGVGINKVQLGMTAKKLKSVLGKPQSIVPRGKEKTDWESSGYVTERELPFIMSFDKVLVYESNKYFIWKIHTSQDEAVYISISSYQEDESNAKNISVNNQFTFYDSFSKVVDVMGSNYFSVDRNETTKLVIYLEKGVSFNFDEYVLRNIYLYKPYSANEAAELQKQIEG